MPKHVVEGADWVAFKTVELVGDEQVGEPLGVSTVAVAQLSLAGPGVTTPFTTQILKLPWVAAPTPRPNTLIR